MGKDYLQELEYLGVTARIKRLSDSLYYSIKELYKYAQIDIEPSWHLVLLVLKEKEEISMFDLANTLNISKPAITKMIKKMVSMDYLIIVSNSSDSRKKMVRLTEKAKSKFPEFQKVWGAGKLAMQDMLTDNEYFLQALENLERENFERSFSERAIKAIKND